MVGVQAGIGSSLAEGAHIRQAMACLPAHSAPPCFEPSEILPADEVSLCGSRSAIEKTASLQSRQDNAIGPVATNTISHNRNLPSTHCLRLVLDYSFLLSSDKLL
jgi:hypothetical protein